MKDIEDTSLFAKVFGEKPGWDEPVEGEYFPLDHPVFEPTKVKILRFSTEDSSRLSREMIASHPEMVHLIENVKDGNFLLIDVSLIKDDASKEILLRPLWNTAWDEHGHMKNFYDNLYIVTPGKALYDSRRYTELWENHWFPGGRIRDEPECECCIFFHDPDRYFNSIVRTLLLSESIDTGQLWKSLFNQNIILIDFTGLHDMESRDHALKELKKLEANENGYLGMINAQWMILIPCNLMLEYETINFQ